MAQSGSALVCDILNPNLRQTHPILVPWVNEMRSQGYRDEQIQTMFGEHIMITIL